MIVCDNCVKVYWTFFNIDFVPLCKEDIHFLLGICKKGCTRKYHSWNHSLDFYLFNKIIDLKKTGTLNTNCNWTTTWISRPMLPQAPPTKRIHPMRSVALSKDILLVSCLLFLLSSSAASKQVMFGNTGSSLCENKHWHRLFNGWEQCSCCFFLINGLYLTWVCWKSNTLILVQDLFWTAKNAFWKFIAIWSWRTVVLPQHTSFIFLAEFDPKVCATSSWQTKAGKALSCPVFQMILLHVVNQAFLHDSKTELEFFENVQFHLWYTPLVTPC